MGDAAADSVPPLHPLTHKTTKFEKKTPGRVFPNPNFCELMRCAAQKERLALQIDLATAGYPAKKMCKRVRPFYTFCVSEKWQLRRSGHGVDAIPQQKRVASELPMRARTSSHPMPGPAKRAATLSRYERQHHRGTKGNADAARSATFSRSGRQRCREANGNGNAIAARAATLSQQEKQHDRRMA